MKKTIIFFMSLVLLISSGTSSLFSYGVDSTDNSKTNNVGSSTDIIITKHNGFKETFYERSSKDFDLTFTLKNSSDADLTDIYVQIEDNESFKPKDRGSKIFLEKNLSQGGTIPDKTIELKYTGGSSSKIPIKIFYKKSDGAELYTTEYIGVNVTPYKEPVKEEPVDTSKFAPVLNVTDSSTHSLEAGTTKTISFTIRNNSDHAAENITISPIITDADNPFSIENLGSSQFFSRIRSNGRESLDLKITTDITTKEKTYPITLKYQFYNRDGDRFTSEETIYVKVINKSTSPKLHIDSINMATKDVQPGEKIDVGFFIKNIGSLEAKNINLSLQGLKNDGFSITNMTNQQYKASLAGDKLFYVSYTLKASDKIESGTHNLDLKLQYKDSSNNNYEDTYQFFINAKGKDSKPSNLFVENIITPNYDIQVGDDFNIKFNLKNNGIGEAKNVKVSLEMDKEIIPKSPSIMKVQKIAPGETKPFGFTLSSTNEAVSKNYPISINIEYEDDTKENEKQILNQYVGVYIEKDGDDNNSKPKIIIDQYNFSPHIVRAGENFDLNISFLNTNRNKSVQNVKIYLTANEVETEQNVTTTTGSVFTPVNSSNTFYIDYIGPKSRVEKNIQMYTVPDAKPKTYNITANIEYEDSDANEHKATEFIGIPVVQSSKLETAEINLPPQAFVGDPLPISLEFYNMGKVTLRNLMIKVEGNFQAENANYFVGNFDAGGSEYYEATIIPTEPGLLEGNIIFSYEDSNGEIVEVVKDFSLNIMEMPEENFPPDGFEGMDPGMENQSKIKKLLTNKIFWFVIVGALAVVTFIIVRKKIIQKKGMSLDE